MAGNHSASSVRRIFKEWRGISERTREALVNEELLPWGAHPVQRDQPHEWHFTIRGPAGSPFENGMYHGKLILPPQYPLQPPSIYFMTMNGRFDVGKPICLTVTQYHPEEWQPAWGIASILDALQAFLPTPTEHAAYSLDWSNRTREQLAAQSVHYRCPTCAKSNKELLTRGHPFIDDPEEEPLDGTSNPSLHSPLFNGSAVQQSPQDEDDADPNTKSLMDEYTIWSSLRLLFWYLLRIAGRQLSARNPTASISWTWPKLLKLVFAVATSAFCIYKCYSTLAQVIEEAWIVSSFPIYRPGQMTVLGENFQLTRAETTDAFPLHPWLQHL